MIAGTDEALAGIQLVAIKHRRLSSFACKIRFDDLTRRRRALVLRRRNSARRRKVLTVLPNGFDPRCGDLDVPVRLNIAKLLSMLCNKCSQVIAVGWFIDGQRGIQSMITQVQPAKDFNFIGGVVLPIAA